MKQIAKSFREILFIQRSNVLSVKLDQGYTAESGTQGWRFYLSLTTSVSALHLDGGWGLFESLRSIGSTQFYQMAEDDRDNRVLGDSVLSTAFFEI
ncbi:hypothetical protein AVEN_71773-1 [Araneus ventricosus]|uniref:Uncharacterized protein n=1 Tax=Araneus ventricosus TaxID=182803 RepID=A0A4Y2VL80_ARAVE|nr:hypothetical protein AVEN_71773-1 [Araneus ventricosus]